ncbi:MAG: TraB/GumN family protein [Litorimonas sp.]
MRFTSTLCLSLYTLLCLSGCGEVTPTGTSVDQKVSQARERNDGPAIWVAKDYDSTLYLFGTVHLLPEDLSWQKEDMRQAFQESGTIFFEVDTSADAQIEAVVLSTSLGMRADGLRLSDGLDNYQLNLLEAAAHNGDLTVASLDAMKPWLAAQFLTFTAATDAGLNPDLAADEALKSRAARQQKNIIYLETTEAQFRASADLPDFVQNAILTETLENYNKLGDDMILIAKSWAIGRTDFLAQELIKPMKARSPELFNSLLRDRNRKWVTTLSRFMEDSGTGFVAVGTAHLLGEGSLIDELREQGYDVRRYHAFKGEAVISANELSIERVRDE